MFSSNGYVSAKWGFDRGWDVYRNFIREIAAQRRRLPVEDGQGLGDAATLRKPRVRLPRHRRAARRLQRRRKEFLVKYWDKPYNGPDQAGADGRAARLIKAGKLKINDNDKAYLEALHDGEITAERRRRSRPSSPT